MNVPIATYRLQFNKNFTFSDLKEILPYLSQLGTSHIYASPIFQAKTGSMHGYDVTDPTAISEELGGRAGFEKVTKEASALGLGWIQDIVPNHASYSVENPRLADVMAKGTGSAYASYFDVDWNYPSEKIRGELFLPFLLQPYRRCMQDMQISLAHSEGGFRIKYGSLELPVNAATKQHLELINSVPEALESYNQNLKLLASLVYRQYYRLGYWKTALRHINYRRFFDITDLVGLRMENQQAFEELHSLIFELATSGMFSGLRADHIDGLYEPQNYLKQLRERCPDSYLVVEKILTGAEQLPEGWPVEGTTGYEFINYLNKLFVKTDSENQIDAAYREFTDNTQAFDELLYDAKRAEIGAAFMGDAVNLARLFYQTLGKIGIDASVGRHSFIEAVVGLLASFPVYRTYIGEQHDTAVFRSALRLAEKRNPQLTAVFKLFENLLNEAENSPEALAAIMRFQQYSGAVMAKGFEDTALYRYPRLLSLNEVGSSPDQFGLLLDVFHEFNRVRQQKWPLTMNATSSHDTKRGEDMRARLNVLSELAEEFHANLREWRGINAARTRQINGVVAPDGCEEYYLYQTLLGAYPFGDSGNFVERIKLHMVKALREAKVHSSWLASNVLYEDTVTGFAQEILSSKDFLDAFLPFQQKVAYYGAVNSLAQTLLKIACPGVPDFYQGTELWDLNLVDPDNRRPVDYQMRKRLLAGTVQLQPDKAPELLQTLETGKAKLYVTYKALQFRHEHKQLFMQGQYLPLAAEGTLAENVVAFLRKNGAEFAIVIVPRFPVLLQIGGGGSTESNRSQTIPPLNKGRSSASEAGSGSGSRWNPDWLDTCIRLPLDAPKSWCDVFTGKELHSSSSKLLLNEVLGSFPVALLEGGGSG
jgi:(1->4)-alpha-D-glucan 1-alpha-D-glucosylmutase